MKTLASISRVLLLCATPLLAVAQAKSGAEQIGQLGGKHLSCIGAEKAGSKNGVAAYTGQWLDSWPGLKNPTGYDAGPYAAEKPLFTITADNSTQYADRLSEGQKALLKKYPKAFRMPVYTSHRIFASPMRAVRPPAKMRPRPR